MKMVLRIKSSFLTKNNHNFKLQCQFCNYLNCPTCLHWAGSFFTDFLNIESFRERGYIHLGSFRKWGETSGRSNPFRVADLLEMVPDGQATVPDHVDSCKHHFTKRPIHGYRLRSIPNHFPASSRAVLQSFAVSFGSVTFEIR